MFGGGSSQATEEQQSGSIAAQEGQYSTTTGGYGTQSCDADAKSFTKCMDDYQGNMQVCSWYLEQLVRIHKWFLHDSLFEINFPAESMPASCQALLEKQWIGSYTKHSIKSVREHLV